MKKKKILLIPKSNSFEDVAQMFFFEKELVHFGHQVESLSGPIFDFNMINIYVGLMKKNASNTSIP